MTVGQKLEEITELKLFQNHMTIEMVLPFFDMKSRASKDSSIPFELRCLKKWPKAIWTG